MTIFNLFALLGGLGLFIYGMNLMSDGLEAAAGNKMRKWLGIVTRDRFRERTAAGDGNDNSGSKLQRNNGHGGRICQRRADQPEAGGQHLYGCEYRDNGSPRRFWPLILTNLLRLYCLWALS